MKKAIFNIAALCVTLFMPTSIFAAGDAKHYPGVFLGFTNSESETDLTIGIEYEYKFDPALGAGFVVERLPDGHDGDGVDIWIASMYYHPINEVRFGLGYGEERIGGKKVKHKDIIRMSAAYEFHFDDFELAPTLDIDFIDGDQAYVFGVAILFPY